MEAPANPRISRWGDATSGQASIPPLTQDIDNGEKRPSSTAPEAPFKKSRLDAAPTQGANAAAGYTGGAASGFSGTSEGLSGLNSGRSAPVGHGYGASSTDQGFGGATGYSGERNFGSFAPGSARGSGTGALFFKTKLCTKFKLGSCTFNERCHFAHGVEELRKPPPGWEEMVKQGGGAFDMGAGGRSSEPPRKSNKPCRFYLEGHCPYGDRCTFSHGNEDTLRESAPTMDPSSAANANASGRSNYKTRLCTRWEKGEVCIYGDKCHFAHGQAELRSFSGGPNYSNTGVTAPNAYTDPSTMNARPPIAASYGAPPPNYGSTSVPPPIANYGGAGVPPASNYASTGVPPPASNYGSTGLPPPSGSANLNPYPISGANVNSYGAHQDTPNGGYSSNYTYWNPENKWDGVSSAVPAPGPTLPMQAYSQPNQTPWMPSYTADGGYPKTDNSVATYYNPDTTQQQQPQQPNPTYYGGASTYQDSNQSINSAYSQDGAQNGVGSSYYTANYANQQPGYTGTYSTV